MSKHLLGDFQEAMDYLNQAQSLGIKPGLERISALLAALGNPEQQIPTIHIAGTNGKGSTSSICTHVLASADYKVGWFTSPYLERFHERIRIITGKQGLKEFKANPSSAEISDEKFRSILSKVVQEAKRLYEKTGDAATEFELLTAVAFVYFADANCDYLVLETGLGGRLDSTNVVTKPLACLITALGYDHMERLGNSLAEIAFEKAGIIKREVPVFLTRIADCEHNEQEAAEARKVISKRASELKAPLTEVGYTDITERTLLPDGQSFRLLGEQFTLKLEGKHQLLNASLAITALQSLKLIDIDQLKDGVEATTWAGRLELIAKEPDILLDGAHNLQGCQVLRNYLNERYAEQEIILVLGILQDKQVEQMLDVLLHGSYKIAELVVTEPPIARSMEATKLLQLCEQKMVSKKGQKCHYNKQTDAVAAVQLALDIQAEKAQRAVVVAGSLYLVGAVRPFISKLRG